MRQSRRVASSEASEASQSDRFIEAARELGCDESEEGFADIVRKVAQAPAPVVEKKKAPKKGAKK